MMLRNYYQILLLCTVILYTDSISEPRCYQCQPTILDYIVTADNLPSLDNCSVVETEQYCLASVIWQLNGKSEVMYDSSKVHFSLEMVEVSIERRASGADQYIGERSITYRCSSSDRLCNTPNKLKRVLISTIFPNDEQVSQLNTLIAVTPFDNASCFIFPNATECPPVDLSNCQRCEVTADFSEPQVCATCPKGSPADVNWFSRSTTYVLNNRTHLMETVTLECQAGNQCNSLANVERIRQATISKFDFDKFFGSDAIRPKCMRMTVITALLAIVVFN